MVDTAFEEDAAVLDVGEFDAVPLKKMKGFLYSHSIMGDDKLVDRHDCCIERDMTKG